jgi:hypothetical protein
MDKIGWHRLSCVCHLCLAVDVETIGITTGWGWVTVGEIENTEHPYWQLPNGNRLYAGGFIDVQEV